MSIDFGGKEMPTGFFDFDLPLERPKWYIYLLYTACGAVLAGVLNFLVNITGLVGEPSFNEAATGLLNASDHIAVLIVLYCIATPFIEDGEIVLLDYKTDRVDDEDTLIRRYRLQLELYKRALEAATDKKVKEVYIYSFDLGSVIKL